MCTYMYVPPEHFLHAYTYVRGTQPGLEDCSANTHEPIGMQWGKRLDS